MSSLDVLLTLKGDTLSYCARQATKPSVMAVLCTNVNKDIKNNSNAHLHVGALMNPHLYSHTLISTSDKAPPPNTHMLSAQPFSHDWLPSPRQDRHVPPKHACIYKRGCLSVVYSVFVNKIPEAIVAVRWLTPLKKSCLRALASHMLVDYFYDLNSKNMRSSIIVMGVLPASKLFFSERLCKPAPPPRLHFSVNIELVPRALEDLRCFYPIWYIKWQIFAFALPAVSQPIGIKST